MNQLRLLARIDGLPPAKTQDVQKSLVAMFMAQVTTGKDQSDYLKTTPYYEKLVADEGIQNDSAKKQALLNRLVENGLHVKAPDEKAVAQYYGISFSATTAAAAQQTLAGLLAYMEGKAAGLVDSAFRNSVTDAVRARELKVSTVEVKTKAERNAMIDTYQMALGTAERAGIKDYAAAGQVDKATVIELGNNNRLFLLGSKYLAAEINTAKTSPLIFPADYYVAKRELDELRPLSEYRVTVPSYFVQLPPTLPVKRDSPKRALILAV